MENPLKGTGQAKVSSVPFTPQKPLDEAKLKEPAKPKEPAKKYRYFYAPRPDTGVHVTDKLRVKFKGNYLKTDSEQVAEYLLARYTRKQISEVTQQQYDKAHTLYVPEPEKVEVVGTAVPKVPQEVVTKE
jgi:hypothetical protein